MPRILLSRAKYKGYRVTVVTFCCFVSMITLYFFFVFAVLLLYFRCSVSLFPLFCFFVSVVKLNVRRPSAERLTAVKQST